MHIKRIAATALTLLGLSSGIVRAEDTDIFTVNPTVTSERPNVLFVVDNTANWEDPFTAEKAALVAAFSGLIDDRYNVGLMLYTESGGGNGTNGNKGPDGGYVRQAVRQMNSVNSAILRNTINGLVKSSGTGDGGSGGVSSLGMVEAYRYLIGDDSYAGGPPGNTLNGKAKSDPDAFITGTARYKSPVTSACAKSFIIFISNGPNQDSMSGIRDATAQLSTYGGNTNTIVLNPNGSQSTVVDEWARFNYANRQIITYAIDIRTKTTGQSDGWTALMQSTATVGKGKYFSITDASQVQSQLSMILDQIFTEILPINSVFASTTLPVSNAVRGTYLNQVYLGLFRPDANSAPNWVGNLKKYKLAANRSTTPASVFLADYNGAAALNNSTGFITPNATSFWTATSSFWNASYYPNTQGSGGISDAPDGELVEKGGAAQYLRTTYATTQSQRPLYTCTGTCATTSGARLSDSPFVFGSGNNAITRAALGAATDTEAANIVNWVRGQNNALNAQGSPDDNPNGLATSIRGLVHGDIVHSRGAVINYGGTSSDVVIFYGDNDGILHAVHGGRETDNTGGDEIWGFVAPEHFGQLKRLRDHTPVVSSNNTKPYFIDGSPTIYTKSTATDGSISASRTGDKAYLYLTMRRGGRFLYALDVTDPATPKILWKRSSSDTGYAALGQTWSTPVVAKVRGQTNPVLFMGMGYDAAANDPATQGTPTVGRGVMAIDAFTGNVIWEAGPSVSGATYTKTVSGMTYDIPADVVALDTDGDSYVDRLYAADTGANLWRINTGNADPAQWTVTKLAALGGSGANARKFLFAPDVVYASPSVATDSVLIGSGDREHPFDTTVVNRYYAIKDNHARDDVSTTVITESSLYDATTTYTPPTSSSGFYITLDTGEKVVGGSTTLNGTVIFGTNIPATVVRDACSSLGEARLYTINYLTGGPGFDVNHDGTTTTTDRYTKTEGGGLPPTPVPVSVNIDGQVYTAAISGPNVIMPPAPDVNRRYRQYWRKRKE